MSQVTSVSQLRDIQPIDWAFQALQSLVERYGCVSGYPDKTFRGNRALTRYEFAAELTTLRGRTDRLEAKTATLENNSSAPLQSSTVKWFLAFRAVTRLE